MQMNQSFTTVRFRLGVERCFETSLPVAMAPSARTPIAAEVVGVEELSIHLVAIGIVPIVDGHERTIG